MDIFDIFEKDKNYCNGWLIKLSNKHYDIDYGNCGQEWTLAIFDINEAIATINEIGELFEFKREDIQILIKSIETEREFLHGFIHGRDNYKLYVYSGHLRQSWNTYQTWQTLEKSCNKN